MYYNVSRYNNNIWININKYAYYAGRLQRGLFSLLPLLPYQIDVHVRVLREEFILSLRAVLNNNNIFVIV